MLLKSCLPSYQFISSIHLSLIRENNLPAAAWRVDGQGLLEALLNIRGPDALRVLVLLLLVVVKLAGVILGYLLVDGLGHTLQSHCIRTLQKIKLIIT